MLPEPGTHEARAMRTSIYESEKSGVLVCAQHFETVNGEGITGYFSMTRKDGGINEYMMQTFRDVYGWDGIDPFWLVDTDLSGIPVEIVVEDQPRDDGSAFRSVKYLNRVGGGNGGLPEVGDRKSILAKYGTRFRAMAGGQQMGKPQAAKPAAAPAQPAAPAQAALPKAPAAPVGQDAPPPCSMQEAWVRFCQVAGDGWSQDGLTQNWYEAVRELTGKEQQDCTEADWGKVKAGAKKFMAEQIVM